MGEAAPPIRRRRLVRLPSQGASAAAPELPSARKAPASGTRRASAAIAEPEEEGPATEPAGALRLSFPAGEVFITEPDALLELLGLEEYGPARRPSRTARLLRIEDAAQSVRPSDALAPDPARTLAKDADEDAAPIPPSAPPPFEQDAAEVEDGEPDRGPLRSDADVAALCRTHLALADAMASAIEARLVDDIDPCVVRSAARIALWRAAQRFDPARGIPFAGYAKRRILGAVFDELRDERRKSRPESPLRAALVARPSESVATAATEDEAAWLASWSACSGIRAIAERGGPRLSGVVDEDVMGAEEHLRRHELLAKAYAEIRGVEPRLRELLERVYVEGLTIEEASLPLSKSWGSRLHASGIAEVQRAMVAAGYGDALRPGARFVVDDRGALRREAHVVRPDADSHAMPM